MTSSVVSGHGAQDPCELLELSPEHGESQAAWPAWCEKEEEDPNQTGTTKEAHAPDTTGSGTLVDTGAWQVKGPVQSCGQWALGQGTNPGCAKSVPAALPCFTRGSRPRCWTLWISGAGTAHIRLCS